MPLKSFSAQLKLKKKKTPSLNIEDTTVLKINL